MATKSRKPARPTPKPTAAPGPKPPVQRAVPLKKLAAMLPPSVQKAKTMADEIKKGGKDEDQTVESLDKVRDILFGQQVRDSEKRFTRLEDRLAKEIADAREDLAKRMTALENFAKSEVDSLIDRLKTEKDERSRADRETAKELEESTKSLEKKYSDLDGRTTDAQREIRKLILDQSKLLRDEMLKSNQELSATLQRAIAELRHDKADRFALGDLLTEMALKLKGEFKMPKGG
jgi:hypothetical protein